MAIPLPHMTPARTLSVFLWELGLAAGGAKGLLLVPVVVDSVVSSVMMAGGGMSSIALAMASGAGKTCRAESCACWEGWGGCRGAGEWSSGII